MLSLLFAVACSTLASNWAFAGQTVYRDGNEYEDFRGQDIVQLCENPMACRRSQTVQTCCHQYLPFGRNFEIGDNLDNLRRIEMADFSHNSIDIIMDNPLPGWDRISHLCLDYNQIKFISENAFDKFCLRKLSLRGNKLSVAKFRLICKDAVPDLIDLSHNFLRGIQTTFRLQPRLIDLSWNLMTTVDMEVYNCSKSLLLTGNKITELTTSKYLNQRQHSYLDLDQNFIRRLEGCIADLKFERLTVTRNKLIGINHDFFHGATLIKYVNISFNQIEEISNTTFNSLHNLETLDVSHNKLRLLNNYGIHNLLGLKKFFASGNPTLQIPPQFLSSSKKLQKLELVGVIREKRYFEQFPDLQHFKWSDSDGLSPFSIPALVPNLRYFSLSTVRIHYLFEELENCNISQMRSIELVDCGLMTIPSTMLSTSRYLIAISFARNLLRNVNLTVFPATTEILNLSSNMISELSTPEMRFLPSIKVLDLQQNRLTNIPSFLYKDETNLLFVNIKDNLINVDLMTNQSSEMKTEFICFNDECIFTKLFESRKRDAGKTSTSNSLACECNNFICNIEDFSSRKILIDGRTAPLILIENLVVGCIKHVTIIGSEYLDLLRMLSSLASSLNSVEIINGNATILNYLPLICSTQIKRIAINYGNLTYMNEGALSSVPHLENLDLSHNKLIVFNLDLLRYCQILENLNLSHNLIESLIDLTPSNCDDIFELKHLDVSHNQLKHLYFALLYPFTRLNTLNASHNKIDNISAQCSELGQDHICHLFAPYIISLAHNYIKEWTMEISLSLSNAYEIDLSDNRFRKFQSEISVSSCSLNLSGNFLYEFEQMQCIDGQFNLQLSLNTISELSKVTLRPSAYLLNLNRNLISQIKFNDLNDKQSLEELYLCHNRIESIDAACFRNMYSLRVLDLQYNKLKYYDTAIFFIHGKPESLWTHYSLEVLNLQCNPELEKIKLLIKRIPSGAQKLSISKVPRIATYHCSTQGSLTSRIPLELETGRSNCYVKDLDTFVKCI